MTDNELEVVLNKVLTDQREGVISVMKEVADAVDVLRVALVGDELGNRGALRRIEDVSIASIAGDKRMHEKLERLEAGVLADKITYKKTIAYASGLTAGLGLTALRIIEAFSTGG